MKKPVFHWLFLLLYVNILTWYVPIVLLLLQSLTRAYRNDRIEPGAEDAVVAARVFLLL